MSLDGVVEIGKGTESDENKMHVDGDETKTPEKRKEKTPFKSKVRDHASRASFKNIAYLEWL